MNTRLRCPGKPEQTNGDEEGANDAGSEPIFRRQNGCILFLLHLDVVLVVDIGSDGGQDDANRGARERHATQTGAPASGALKDDGIGRKVEIHGAVDDNHVDGGDQNDWLSEQKDPRPYQRDLELLPGRGGWLVGIESRNLMSPIKLHLLTVVSLSGGSPCWCDVS